ncbi:SseB family protein [Salinispora sp. H7-4]|uniref:SseB family protein n=1 Tax=Salinispora sp. H7-4 TaxID=2748321 RepID=UPI0015D10C4C|nr:SseB family protein [Salinispora sp. H7-4]NYT93204.1 SseB family protein [Salinispora sp. H7-4]
MTTWEPATEAEVTLRDALLAKDQQRYFRVLARTELLLPVSAQALAGQAPMNWGTWTTGGRTHVLAFTSVAALRACLGEHAGANRRAPYAELADHWPNHEWWLAVNPGLPIEGYLPAWYVAQLSRGDVRLPGRTMGTRARLERDEAYSRTRPFGRGEGEPAAGAKEPDRAPRAGQTPEGVTPLRPSPPASSPAAPLRTPADLRAATLRRPTMDAGRVAGGEPVTPGARPPGPGLGHQPVSGAASPREQPRGRSGPPPSRRSFFEPAAGRGDRDEQGVRPSRLARGAQQFPRRRPAGEPPPVASPMFSARATTQVDQDAAAPSGETAPGLVRQQTPTEETRTVRFPVPDPATLRRYARRTAEEERALQPRPNSAEAEPGPITEPASSPLPRRTAPPTVIEGTVVDSRNLIAAGTADVSTTVPMSTMTGVAPDRGDSAVPAAGDPTLPDADADVGAEATLRIGVARADDLSTPSPTPTPTAVVPPDFEPANEVEADLVTAAISGNTDTFLSTLLLAQVLLPVAADSAPDSRPGGTGFVWRTEEQDGTASVVVYTSPERLADHTAGTVETIRVRFVQLIQRWPDRSWSFAVNPGTPIGTTMPGEQIVGLANWAAEVGLGADRPEPEPEPGLEPEPEPAAPAASAPADSPATADRPRYRPPSPDSTTPVLMQKAVASSQLAYYLDRGYDRVSGFVHRAAELAHLTTPAQLYDALGLGYPGSPFERSAEKIYVLRWPAFRPNLYRIPYGGQSEAAMRAMEGWVIERPPFRGNGFAPSESSDVVAEFKVDSARLPHGAQLWRIGADGAERLVATLDVDALRWRQAGDG